MSKIVKVCKKHGPLTLDQIKIEPAPKNTRLGGITYRCAVCRKERNDLSTIKDREKRKLSVKKYGNKNREQLNEWARKDRENNPNKYRRLRKTRRMMVGNRIINNEILRKYGLTIEAYEKMCNDQNDLCAICNRPEKRKSRTPGEITRLTIDHCHYSENLGINKVRGLLCAECNAGLGKFRDDTIMMAKAILYLEKHHPEIKGFALKVIKDHE